MYKMPIVQGSLKLKILLSLPDMSDIYIRQVMIMAKGEKKVI